MTTRRFLVLGDIHDRLDHVATILQHEQTNPPAGVLCVGDISSLLERRRDYHWDPGEINRWRTRVMEFVELVERMLPHVPLVYVRGNHDWREPGTPEDLSLMEGRTTVAGVRVTGFGGAGPERFGFPFEWDEADALLALPRPPYEPGILLCHAPPKGLCDRTMRGDHVGSEAIREVADEFSGVLLCGHIHEAAGAVQHRDCLVVNAGSFGEPWPNPRGVRLLITEHDVRVEWFGVDGQVTDQIAAPIKIPMRAR